MQSESCVNLFMDIQYSLQSIRLNLCNSLIFYKLIKICASVAKIIMPHGCTYCHDH